MLDGRADVAVHSAKDLPVRHTRRPRARRGARARRPARRARRLDPRRLPAGARVAHRIGAPPRAARGAAARPHVRRAARQHRHPARAGVADFDAVVVAAAALDASGSRDRSRPSVLDPSRDAPAGRAGRARGRVPRRRRRDAARVLAAIDDPTCTRAVGAERAFLAELGGGCDLPCGALAVATVDGDEIEIDGAARRHSTATSCCGATCARRRPGDRRHARSPAELLDRGGAPC